MNQPGLNELRGKRVAFSHYSSDEGISGVTTWLERLVLRLHGDGVPTSVLLHHYGPNAKSSRLFRDLLAAGVHVEIERKPAYTECGVRSTLAFLNRHRPQVFLPHCLEAMYYAAGIAGQAGLPWVVTLHSDDPVYWAIARAVAPEANGGLLVGVSEGICQQAAGKLGASRPRHIPYGVTLPGSSGRFARFSHEPFHVAFCGRVEEEQKRILLVLAAMELACRRDARVEGVILGDGSMLTPARNWVAERGLADRIRFSGGLGSAMAQQQLADCQALLMMSDFEGLPLVLLEAMAAGVVPVARAIPSGVPELVKDRETGLLVDASPESAADAILSLAGDPELWAQCSTAAMSLVERQFGEDLCYERWVHLLAGHCLRDKSPYPVAIPHPMPLPPPDPVLKGRDIRRRSFLKRVRSRCGVWQKVVQDGLRSMLPPARRR